MTDFVHDDYQLEPDPGIIMKHTLQPNKIFNDKIIRSVDIRYHGNYPEIAIVEPLVEQEGMDITQGDPGLVEITSGNKKFTIRILEGDAEIKLGRNQERYWSPYPSYKCYPVELIIAPDTNSFTRKIKYEIALLN